MHSCTWMNGQYRAVGPPSQFSAAATPLTYNIVWNQQAGRAYNTCQSRTSNRSVQPQQSAHFTFLGGAYSNRQTSILQTSAVPRQAVSSQQPAGGKTNNYYVKVSHGDEQNSNMNMQSGNPLDTNGLKVATQQDFHLDSGFINSSIQSPRNMMKANTINPQQDMSAHWNQQRKDHSKQSAWIQGVNVFDQQHCKIIKSLLQNVNRESTIPDSAHITTATSLPHEQVACSSKLVSATAHNSQTAHNQYHRQNGTQHGFFPSTPPPSYSASPKTRQYPIQVNATHNNGEEAIHHLTSKTNELPAKPAADAQEEMLRQQMIARIADHLMKSFTASSDGCPPVCTSSHYKEKQFVREGRMMEPNQNAQPATLAVTDSFNANASQSLPLNSGLSLPKTTHSVMSRTQHIVNAPQQSSAPNAFHVTKTGDYCREKSKPNNGDKPAVIFFPLSNMVLNRNVVGSLTYASQLMKLPESISPQTKKTKSSVANNREMLSTKANDSSIHSSPGRSGTKAVAVVQPLSQESYQDASKHTYSDRINHSADKSVLSRSAASSDCTFVSSSDSADARHSQKQLRADDTGSGLAINIQADQHVAPNAQQLVTSEVPVSQSGDEDKRENQTDPKAKVFELSSVPTLPWTTDTLLKLMLEEEKAQMKLGGDFKCEFSWKLLNMFWDSDIKNLASKLKGGWYIDLITQVKEFCSKHVTSDTVILSQVKQSFEKQLQSYHVLKDKEVYSEPPYKSSWLNINEQLDDIDKEFGIPCSLKRHIHMHDNHSQPDQVWAVNNVPAQIVSEVPKNTELEQVDSAEEKQPSTVEATSTQAAFPNKTESVDSSDPYYSFEIQVLPPEEAKVIFKHAHSKMQQSLGTDSQPDRVMNSSEEGDLLEAIDVPLNDSKLKNKSDCPIERICCISRWMEMICGSSIPSSSKCQCKIEQSSKADCTDNNMAVQKEDNLGAIRFDSELHTEGENPAKGENIDSQNVMYSQSEQGNKVSQTIAEEDCIQGQFKSTGSTQSCTSVSKKKEIENPSGCQSEAVSQISDHKDHYGQAQLTSTDVAESSSEPEEQQTQIVTPAPQTTFCLSGKHKSVDRKRKRRSIHDRFFPNLKKSNKCKPPADVDSQPSTCREVSVDATESEPLAPKVRAVQLVLFGSVSQDKCVLTGSRRHTSYPGVVGNGVPRPPEVISVNLSPLKRKPIETVLTGEHSVKGWIHEKRRTNFSPTKIWCRSKLKTQKCTPDSLSGVNLQRAETVVPTNTEKLPVSSKIRTWNWNQNARRCLRRRRRSLSNRLKRQEKTKKNVVTLKQPADQERSNAKNESYAVMPLQGNNVLRFILLPKTFSFQNASHERKETGDPDPNKLALGEGKDKSSSETVKVTGVWCPGYSKREKYSPLRKPPVPKTSSLFQEFQKKFIEKTQPSMDE